MFWGQNLATVGILALRARQIGFPASSPWWCGLQLQWPLQASNGCGSLVCYLSKGCEDRLFYFFCWKTSAWASKVTIYSKKNAWCTKDPFEGHSPFWAFGRNFDRSTVKGVVAKLFHIKPDFVGTTVLLWGRKIGQCVVWQRHAHHFLFFVPCWWMPLAALFCQGQLPPCLGGLRGRETLLCDRRQRRDGQSVAGEGPIEVGRSQGFEMAEWCYNAVNKKIQKWTLDYEWT